MKFFEKIGSFFKNLFSNNTKKIKPKQKRLTKSEQNKIIKYAKKYGIKDYHNKTYKQIVRDLVKVMELHKKLLIKF